MVLGVTGRQKVFDSSAVICSASLQGDAIQVNVNAVRGVIGIEENVDAGQTADGLVNGLRILGQLQRDGRLRNGRQLDRARWPLPCAASSPTPRRRSARESGSGSV